MRPRLAILALLLAPLAARTAAAAVEAGPIVNPANGHSYYLLTPASWFAAEDEARALGGHLVAIGDAAENGWIWSTFAALGSPPFWIGLTDVAQEGTFVWTNGEPFVYSSWWVDGGEPNNAGGVEHFVEINNAVWNDNAGDGPLRGIAEVEDAFGFIEAEATPPAPTPEAFAGVVDLEVSPDGAHVYALYDVSPGDDSILIYERASDGTIAPIGSVVVAFNPSAMAIAPDGSAVFVATNNGELQAWERDAETGLLTYADGVSDSFEGGGYLLYAAGLAVSPDSEHLYVSSGENAVTSFTWDATAGELTLIETDVTGTGGLILAAPGSIVVTPDGTSVLVVSQLDYALVAFDRDPESGALAFAERFVDNVNGVDGLDGGLSLVAAPTTAGTSAYVSSFELELAVFAEALSGPTPGVSFVEAVQIGELQPMLAVSPDGTLLYAANRYTHRLTARERDPGSGDIGAVVAAISDTDAGVNGLLEAGAVAVSHDGLHVYVASYQDDAIAVLAAPAPAPEPGALGLALAALAGLAAHARRRRPS